ncbi:MAG: 2-methyl-6-phytyl-1,4-hydroquinone methyltransferase [Alphaproteobacteria bacterium MarineAlpha5_Bin11]|nr:SAM-dependent methyltransferase [Pelagibacteraceae bacterium]PPR42298.1 MAG: 2-methyl-6-phytyl-1,4-hydroquinone methyltransferase [Alphaproteobacteria bacterium MarineAlpha5_Bin11]PPR49758.1 MAG: 2-methyl-6-phytyl-1,4-hydroquinone methyltransferase [Alphaproteobacteria bacterium MarineAlpha5_Bin10]|tara:strand:- start:327 stop:1112 length:786 start_codon:yes stop_codon:yes gene_type:complete
MSITDEGHYGPKQLNLLKVVWGEGFLSPGGTNEIDEVMEGINSLGKEILDIGCGCGGAAIHLIKKHGAKSVLGIDVEPLVIKKAKELAAKYNLSGSTDFRCVRPGPLDMPDESVDIVFSKEVFLHIPNKEDLLKDIYRVLKPKGIVAVSDWMRIDDNPPSKQMREYIAAEGLDMHMYSLKRYEQVLKNSGFTNIVIKDRNKWYHNKAKKELAAIEGSLKKQVVDVIGLEETNGAIDIWKQLIGVLETGEHRPGHFKAVKIG